MVFLIFLQDHYKSL